ncbi:O-acyltransferase WSD1, partial [Bienertia sinuspersici]
MNFINCPKGHSAASIAILKTHHVIGDGTSLMGIVFSCFRKAYDPSLSLTFPSETLNTSTNEHTVTHTIINIFKSVPRFISSIIYSFHDFGQGLKMLFLEDIKTPIRSGTTDMTRPFSTRVCSVTISLNNVKRIKTLLQVTVNDVIVGIIFHGTRLYIKEVNQGQEIRKTCSTASTFVNIRSMKGNLRSEEMCKTKTWGNQITNIELPLPIFEDEDVANPLKFIKKSHKIIKNKRLGIYGPFLMIGLLDTGHLLAF